MCLFWSDIESVPEKIFSVAKWRFSKTGGEPGAVWSDLIDEYFGECWTARLRSLPA